MKKLLLLASSLFLLITNVFAQQTVSGRVTDDKGTALEGISVKLKGTTTGTTTDKNGDYTIKVSGSNPVLIFSGVGFNDKEIDAYSAVNVSMEPSSITLTGVEMVGTRSLKRSSTETPVPVDIIPISKVVNQLGLVEINSILHYVAPSFNANRQSGADGADHIDPATLRGLGPDQTLVLINGKRRHQISLVNLYGSRGRGNTGTDLNSIPAAAIERIEILRDGASAQYGSDAIAGVVNIILKSSVNELTATATAGTQMTGYGGNLDYDGQKVLENQTDGFQYNANVNYGFKLEDKGFLNVTGDIVGKNKTFRPNYEPIFPDNYRQKFGDGSYENYRIFFNNKINIGGVTDFYSFGGYNRRNGSAYAFTRDAGSERNVVAIYPDGFDPIITSEITDKSISFGIRTKFCGWNSDFNGTAGSNRFHYGVENTLNASLEENSPTEFDAGGFQLNQNTLSANFTKEISGVGAGLNLAFGSEYRYEQYQIFAGETGSWKQYVDADGHPPVFSINGPGDTTFRPGGSQGFPGFQPKDIVKANRKNFAAYADAELDITKSILIAGAVRIENYSDFGWTDNYKLATKLKLNNNLSFRGSWSTGFRAPSLPQIHFSSTFTNVVAGQIFDQVIAPNTSELAKEAGIPELKEETSNNLSIGFVAKIAKKLTLTVDAYKIKVKDRIVLTGLFDINDDKIGLILQSMNVGAAQFFTNAVDTRTNGFDIIATYSSNPGRGKLNTTLAANFNNMEILAVHTTPLLAGKEEIYFGVREKYFLLASAPDHKINLSFDYTINRFNAFVRLTRFSGVKLIDFNFDETMPDIYKSRHTLDLTLGYKINDNFDVAIGGANVLDSYPSIQDPGLTETGGMWDAVQMGHGGAFFFAKLAYRFKTK
ncbi:MAG TPA: TonB-dependent receptor [Chitinophagaceae bacterium]|nr:TonB-dependent receptor [Chitinophagaceae bacterium]